MASLTALAAARHRAAAARGWDVRAAGLQGDGRARLVLYTSSEGHSCVRKSAELLGLGSDAVRVLPADAAFRMDLGALDKAVARDRAAGLAPFCVSATAGTVGTGARVTVVDATRSMGSRPAGPRARRPWSGVDAVEENRVPSR